MKNFLLAFLFLALAAHSQTTYKYAVIAEKFSFQRESNQYGLNILTKMFFQKLGYETYVEGEIMPEDLVNQNCNRLIVDVLEENSLLNTKVYVVIKDCRNNVIYTSAKGSSKEKKYQTAYTEALREALKSIEGAKLAPLKAEAVAVSPPKSQIQSANPSLEDSSPELFTAQATETGYQLIDLTPKVILRISATSDPKVFIASDEQSVGVWLQRGHVWVYEYYNGKKLQTKTMNIKF